MAWNGNHNWNNGMYGAGGGGFMGPSRWSNDGGYGAAAPGPQWSNPGSGTAGGGMWSGGSGMSGANAGAGCSCGTMNASNCAQAGHVHGGGGSGGGAAYASTNWANAPGGQPVWGAGGMNNAHNLGNALNDLNNNLTNLMNLNMALNQLNNNLSHLNLNLNGMNGNLNRGAEANSSQGLPYGGIAGGNSWAQNTNASNPFNKDNGRIGWAKRMENRKRLGMDNQYGNHDAKDNVLMAVSQDAYQQNEAFKDDCVDMAWINTPQGTAQHFHREWFPNQSVRRSRSFEYNL